MNRLVSSYNRWSWGCLLRMTWWVVAAPWHQHPKRNGSNITCKVPHNAQGPFFFRRNDATGRRAFCFFLASDLRLGQWAREGDAIFVCGVHWSEHVNISRAIPSQSSWMRQIDGRLGRGPYLFSFFFSAFSYSFPSSTHSLRAQSRSLLADQSTLWCLCPRQGQAELRDVYCFPRRVSWLIRPW